MLFNSISYFSLLEMFKNCRIPDLEHDTTFNNMNISNTVKHFSLFFHYIYEIKEKYEYNSLLS